MRVDAEELARERGGGVLGTRVVSVLKEVEWVVLEAIIMVIREGVKRR